MLERTELIKYVKIFHFIYNSECYEKKKRNNYMKAVNMFEKFHGLKCNAIK